MCSPTKLMLNNEELRAFHLLDTENELGRGKLKPGDVENFLSTYQHLGIYQKSDQGLYATSRTNFKRCSHERLTSMPGLEWVKKFYDGEGAADLSLMESEDPTTLARRFKLILLGTGDGDFCDYVERLKNSGALVIVVHGLGRFSRQLKSLADGTIDLFNHQTQGLTVSEARKRLSLVK